MISVRGFVSHAFDDAAYEGGRAMFRSKVERLVRTACEEFEIGGQKVESELFFEATGYGGQLMPGVRTQIRRSDFLVADISQTDAAKPVNPNVMYEVGFAMALHKPVLIIRRNSEPLPPSDIGDLLAGSYDSLSAIPKKFLAAMTEMVRATLARANREVEEVVAKVWFPADTRSISLVCCREPEPTRFSDRREPNYVHIDNFEDRDALLELSTFFARRYPQAIVIPYLADEMPQNARYGDLVVLGGPGCIAGEGNAVARDLMQMLDSSVSYPESGEGLVWNGGALRSTEYDDDDDTRGVRSDWGSIMAAPNPYNEGARVVLIHGTTTSGTLGAAIALTDTRTALRNHIHLASLGFEDPVSGSINFEALIRAEVDSGMRVKPTSLDMDAIRRIEG